MVHLSPSPSPDLALSPSPECSPVGNNEMSRMDSPTALGSIQLALAASTTTYHGYDTYIEDGLICLKHKIRNIEKKKLKLEDYKKRLDNGENLNQDQMDAVNKYEEVVHNLTFAKELQKSFASLTQDLLKAQRKVARREQVVRIEAEKRRLRTVLQVQYILQSLLQEHVRKDFRSGLNQAPFLSAHEVEHLLELAKLLGCQRDESMSLQDQMEQAAAIYWDLLEGRDKVVAGCTCKHLKDQLTRLMDCSYFDHIPSPHIENLDDTELLVTKKLELSKKVEVTKSTGNLSGLSTLMSANEVPTREFLGRRFMPDSSFSGQAQPEKSPTLSPKWKADFLALKQRDPPDSWEMEFDMTPTVKPALQKTWKGAAGFIPKEPGVVTKLEPKQETKTESESEPKQRRMRKLRGEQDKKLSAKADVPVEVFRSPTALTKDPVQRKQQLKSLMDQIQGSFSFMQDSILDSESSPIKRISTISAPSIGTTSTETAAQSTPNSQEKHLPKSLHSTPLPLRLHTNGDQMDEDKAAQIRADNSELSESEDFASPPLYRQESATSVAESVTDQVVEQATCNGTATFPSPPSSHSTSSPAPFTAMHTVFKMSTPLPPRSDSDQKSDTSAYSDTYNLSYVTASTQTPPDIDLQDLDTVQPVNTYPSEYPVSNGCQVYLSPGPPGGAPPRTNQQYYSRGSVRGMTRGGRGLTQPFRSPGGYRAGSFDGYRAGLRSPGGYIPQTHSVRDCGPVLYGVRDTGYHSGYKRSSTGAAGTRSSRAWNSPSQMSSPDRDETFTSMDSGHGDSRCTTPIDVPVASPAFMPMHVYPVPQQMRVAFSAARTANFAPGSLDQPIVFDLLHSNLGETFDVDLGRFNCPVNGTYVFIFHILKLAVNVPLYVNLMKNEEVMVSAYANDGAPDHETASNHAVLQLYHGDQVWLRLHRGAIYGSSWKYSTFSGYLLYQD